MCLFVRESEREELVMVFTKKPHHFPRFQKIKSYRVNLLVTKSEYSSLFRVLVFISFPCLGEGSLSSSNANVKFVLNRLQRSMLRVIFMPRCAVFVPLRSWIGGRFRRSRSPKLQRRGAVLWNHCRGAVIRNRLICMNILQATATVRRLAPLTRG